MSRCRFLSRFIRAFHRRLLFDLDDCDIDWPRRLAFRACDDAQCDHVRIDIVHCHHVPTLSALMSMLPSHFSAHDRHSSIVIFPFYEDRDDGERSEASAGTIAWEAAFVVNDSIRESCQTIQRVQYSKGHGPPLKRSKIACLHTCSSAPSRARLPPSAAQIRHVPALAIHQNESTQPD